MPNEARGADPAATFAAAFDAPLAAARAAKAAGRPVVGYLSATAPVELIEAAGAFAVRLDGGGVSATPHADAIMERLFDPPVRGACERLLSGELSFLDAAVLPRTTDSVQRLYYYLCEVRRTGGAAAAPLLYDLLHTPFYSSAEYNYRSLAALELQLESVVGAPIAEAQLAEAIAVSNRRIAALEAFAALRREGAVSGVQALEAYTAARTMAPGAFLNAMGELLRTARLQARIPSAAPANCAPGGARSIPVVVAGNGPDTRALHQAIEAAGARVAGDFHDRGELSVGAPISETLPPLRALSERYHRGATSARTFPSRAEAAAAFARAAGAEAAIFFFYAEEEVLTWDYPAQRRALEAAGIASLCLSAQPYHIDADATRAAVSAFLSQRRAA